MQPMTTRRQRPWARYAPFVVVGVIVVIVATALVVRERSTTGTAPTATHPATAGRSGVPILYTEAKAAGTLARYTWPPDCDTSRGVVAIPVLDPPPCVPDVPPARNGGATSPGVTAGTIKIGYYIAKPDPITDALLAAAGAYDTPENTARAFQDYVDIYAHRYELYGRRIQLVRIDGTGTGTDDVAARADADRAAAAGVFAVIGGPTQTSAFSSELAAHKILCVGFCIISEPEPYYRDHSPYVWPVGPSPEQASLMVTELVRTQLAGRTARYTDDPNLRDKPRSFVMLSYDTPDGRYKSSWDALESDLRRAGVRLVGRVNYFLNLASLQADARTVATKLKATGATSVVFSGDPIFPKFLTAQMTEQGYFPEWVMSGTVLADTNVFARTFDQAQWKHAFGLQLIPARLPKDAQDAYTLHRWWYGTSPPTDHSYPITKGDVELLFDGLQLAGPHLTPETFRDGLYHLPPVAPGRGGRRTISTYGRHGFWPGTDPAGLDNAGVLYWDPDAVGADETGTVGKGMYRLVDGGRRYLPGRWPTTPIRVFDPAGTVTIYPEGGVPPDLLPTPYPTPPEAPASASARR